MLFLQSHAGWRRVSPAKFYSAVSRGHSGWACSLAQFFILKQNSVHRFISMKLIKGLSAWISRVVIRRKNKLNTSDTRGLYVNGAVALSHCFRFRWILGEWSQSKDVMCRLGFRFDFGNTHTNTRTHARTHALCVLLERKKVHSWTSVQLVYSFVCSFVCLFVLWLIRFFLCLFLNAESCLRFRITIF